MSSQGCVFTPTLCRGGGSCRLPVLELGRFKPQVYLGIGDRTEDYQPPGTPETGSVKTIGTGDSWTLHEHWYSDDCVLCGTVVWKTSIKNIFGYRGGCRVAMAKGTEWKRTTDVSMVRTWY